MGVQALLWGVAAGALSVAVAAGFADHRRNRRRDLERVGWVPWSLVQIIAAIAAAAAMGLALHV